MAPLGVVCQWGVGKWGGGKGGDVGGDVGFCWGVDQGVQGVSCTGDGGVDGVAKRGGVEDRVEHNGQDKDRGPELRAVCSCWRGVTCDSDEVGVVFSRKQSVGCR